MEFVMKIPEGIFRTAKTPEQVDEEMRQAAAVFWVARGDVAPEVVRELTAPSTLSPQPEPQSGAGKEGTLLDLLMQGPSAGAHTTAEGKAKEERTLMDLLSSMPDVGEDADFERPLDYGRPVVDLD